ncbi:RHS repeat-associated core domain-containing protein [Streptomyces sp. NPDC058613]|uniref:RHS repeat domain-containing protein n=1 Tax=Streptomyces sp. NPDC058613 TaxID=3346556 RepID=UPI00364C061D
MNKAGQAMDAVRYYSGPGPTTVRRTNGKTTGHKLSLLLTDHHNTATITVDQSANQAVTRRKSDPYGNPRGTQPGNWPGNRSFLGTGVDDTDTGLTHIGAREYEPTTGRFISVDPIIDITDPLQMNGYTYANGNPITGSDPTGLKADNCAHVSNCTANGGTIDETPPPPASCGIWCMDHGSTTSSSSGDGQGPTITKGNKGSSGGSKTSGGKKECGWSFKCHTKKAVKATTEWVKENKVAIVAITVEVVVGVACIGGAVAAGAATGGVGFALAAGCGAIAGAAGAAVTNAMTPGADHSVMGVLKDIAIGGAVGAAGGVLGVAAGVAAKAASKVIGKGVSSLLAKVRPKNCSSNSFAAGTLVLMADGSTKAINELQPGDKVLATDPETGQTVARTYLPPSSARESRNSSRSPSPRTAAPQPNPSPQPTGTLSG